MEAGNQESMFPIMIGLKVAYACTTENQDIPSILKDKAGIIYTVYTVHVYTFITVNKSHQSVSVSFRLSYPFYPICLYFGNTIELKLFVTFQQRIGLTIHLFHK